MTSKGEDENSLNSTDGAKDDNVVLPKKRSRGAPKDRAAKFVETVNRNRQLPVEEKVSPPAVIAIEESRNIRMRQIIQRNRDKCAHTMERIRSSGLLELIEDGIGHVLDCSPEDPIAAYSQYISINSTR